MQVFNKWVDTRGTVIKKNKLLNKSAIQGVVEGDLNQDNVLDMAVSRGATVVCGLR